jgi:hypothetical protein
MRATRSTRERPAVVTGYNYERRKRPKNQSTFFGPGPSGSPQVLPPRRRAHKTPTTRALFAPVSAAIFLRESLRFRFRTEDVRPLSVLQDALIAAAQHLQRARQLAHVIEVHRVLFDWLKHAIVGVSP